MKAVQETWIRVEETGPISILTPMGPLDSKGNAALTKAIEDATTQDRYRILVNLQNVPRIGSQTIQTLLEGASTVDKNGGDLRLLNANRGIVRYLKNNRVYDQFDIYDDRGAAIADFLGKLSSRRSREEKPEPTEEKPTPPEPQPEPQAEPQAEPQPEPPIPELTQVLVSNSYMLATLIDMLQEKKILNTDDVKILLERPDQSAEERA